MKHLRLYESVQGEIFWYISYTRLPLILLCISKLPISEKLKDKISNSIPNADFTCGVYIRIDRNEFGYYSCEDIKVDNIIMMKV